MVTADMVQLIWKILFGLLGNSIYLPFSFKMSWCFHTMCIFYELSGDMSFAECKTRCDDMNGCTGITTLPSSEGKISCFRKSNVNLGQCDHGTPFSTYVKQTWTKAGGFNCYGPRSDKPGDWHGATDLENPPSSSCGVMSLSDCQKRCAQTVSCDGITVSSAGNGKVNCYRKAVIDMLLNIWHLWIIENIVLGSCDTGSSFDTYVTSTTKSQLRDILQRLENRTTTLH